MAFRFVLGRAGSGKSAFCLQEIKRKLAAEPEGPPLILIVPEQATFQAEYAIASDAELGGTIRAQVFSFRRLALRILQEVGGALRLPIDESGKKLLLYRVIQQLQRKGKGQAQLRQLDRATGQLGFLDHLSDLLGEFKRQCIEPETLNDYYAKRFGQNEEHGGLLQNKLHDLRLIYTEYEQQLSGMYLDGEGYLAELADKVERSDFLKNAECWIDGFHRLTPQEINVLAKLGLHTKAVTLTLCLDRPYGESEALQELDLFHRPARTMIRMRERLRELGVAETEPAVLSGNPPLRFRERPMLAHLESQWGYTLKSAYRPSAEEHTKRPIQLAAAVSRRAEAEGAAREIVRLAREENVRWRDIAVSLRNMDGYADLLGGIFKDYGIPHFFDRKRSVLHHPLAELVRSSLEAVANNWKYDAVIRCVKTGFFLSPEEPYGLHSDEGTSEDGPHIDAYTFDQMENYVLAFGIQGTKWRDPEGWTYSYRTSLEREDSGIQAADEQFLHQMNTARLRIAGPLGELQDRLKESGTVRQKAEALYGLLIRLHVPLHLEAWSRRAQGEGRIEEAREHAQMWERMIDMIDQLVELTGSQHRPGDECSDAATGGTRTDEDSQKISAEMFNGLVETGLESMRLGLVPPTLDQVLVGTMDRTRSGQIRHLFVLGINEGVMPAKAPMSGVLTEQERESLSNADNGLALSLAEGGRRQLLDESFLIYYALCTPSDGLWLSYPLADEEGKSLLPSDVIRQVRRMFPFFPERLLLNEPAGNSPDDEQLRFVSRPIQALSLLLVQLKQWFRGTGVSPVWWSVYNWFAKDIGGQRYRLSELIPALRYTNQTAGLSSETSRALYGEELETSVSRMERFVACPFSQFSSHGLRLQERKLFRLEAPDIGQLFHAALSKFVDQAEVEGLDWSMLTAETSEQRAAQVIDALAPRLRGEILLSSKRYRYIARKLKQIIGRAALMLGEHAKRGQFRPVGLEVGFGRDEPIPPLVYGLDGGARMLLRGRIDRIDRADTERGMLLRVIDYKSSAKSLHLSEVYYGLSLQMLTYLDVILTHAPVWLGQAAEPAGVLYFHVHNPVLNAKNNMQPDEIDKELKRRFKMKGLLRADPAVIRLMDSGLGEAGHSDLVPAALKADGAFYKTSSVASEAEWDTVRRHVKRTMTTIGSSLVKGNIDIAPYKIGSATACSTCSFQPVCQFDAQIEGNGFKMLPSLTKEVALERMARETADLLDGQHDVIASASASYAHPGEERPKPAPRNKTTKPKRRPPSADPALPLLALELEPEPGDEEQENSPEARETDEPNRQEGNGGDER